MPITLGFDWQRPGAMGAMSRSLDEKVGEIVSIADWGVPGGLTVYIPGVTEKIQAALDEAPIGSTLLFPKGLYYTDDTLTLTRYVNLVFEADAHVSAVFDDVTKNVFEVLVEEGLANAGDVRRMQFSGATINCAVGFDAKHTLHIANAAPMVGNLQMLFYNCEFIANDDQAGSAVHIEGLTTQAHTFFHCSITNQVHLDANADGCSFLYCLVFGTKTAFLVDVGAGAFKTEISHNLIAARDGAMRLIGGSQLDFIRNQVEQPSSGLDADKQNANAHAAHVIVDAVSYSLRGVNIERNNFGGGVYVDYSVWLDATGTIFTGALSGTVLTVTAVSQGKILSGMVLNASGITAGTTITSIPGTGTGGAGTYNVSASQTLGSRTITGLATIDGTLISRNTFGETDTGTDIKLASPAVKYTLIEADQELRGVRGSGNFTIYPAYSTNTDNVRDLLVIDDSGTGTAHVKKTAVALGGASATALLNSWVCAATTRFWRDRHVVRFEGHAVAPGSTQTDVVIGTLPEGFRPNQQLGFVVPAYVGGIPAAAFGVVNTNGTVQLSCAASATVYLSGIQFEGKREGYDPGY